MKKTAIFKAIMALFVIMLGVNFNADAQIGKTFSTRRLTPQRVPAKAQSNRNGK